MNSIYFSCPKFTVRLVADGAVIREAAPIVTAFEGQTIGVLRAWAESKFGGPIIVHELPKSGTDARSLDSNNQSRFPRGNRYVYPS